MLPRSCSELCLDSHWSPGFRVSISAKVIAVRRVGSLYSLALLPTEKKRRLREGDKKMLFLPLSISASDVGFSWETSVTQSARFGYKRAGAETTRRAAGPGLAARRAHWHKYQTRGGSEASLLTRPILTNHRARLNRYRYSHDYVSCQNEKLLYICDPNSESKPNDLQHCALF